MITEENLQKFKAKSNKKYKELFKTLAEEGQKPHTLFITCSDSRINPHLVTHTKPGEIFVLRNIGNMVPPYHEKKGEFSTLAAVEYAVLNLNVGTIIVCGHSHCGACAAIWNPDCVGLHTRQWLALAEPIKEALENGDNGMGESEREFVTEQLNVVLQLDRLRGYPFIAERLERGEISLVGWHYLIESGDVLILDENSGEFMQPGSSGAL